MRQLNLKEAIREYLDCTPLEELILDYDNVEHPTIKEYLQRRIIYLGGEV